MNNRGGDLYGDTSHGVDPGRAGAYTKLIEEVIEDDAIKGLVGSDSHVKVSMLSA